MAIETLSIHPQIHTNTRRCEFDALRGVSMILVVYAHVLMFGHTDYITGSIFTTFRMPLFFFVSGFFAFRTLDIWNKQFYKRVFSRKIKAQIICTIVFFMFTRHIGGLNPLGWIHKGFQEYWFTIVLFQMFSVYALINLVSKLVRKDITLWVMAVVSISAFIIILLGLLDGAKWERIFSTIKFCYYLQWFTLGLFARCYEEKFNKFISNDSVKALLIIGFISLFTLTLNHNIYVSKFWRSVSVLTSYFGLLTVISLFFYAKDFFYGDSVVARSLRFTGQRTLDIYMIHYPLLPVLPALLEWLAPNSMVIFQLIIIFGIASLITAVSLLISSCLRSSNFLANWLFGVTPKKNYEPATESLAR